MSVRLSPKEHRFVSEYLKDQNGTQAAIRAGYSKRSARTIAARLLAKAHINEAVNQKLNEIEKDAKLTAAKVQDVVFKMLSFDPRLVLNKDGTTKHLNEMTPEVLEAIAGFETDEFQGKVTKIRFVDRVRAAELAAKILGMLRFEVTGKDGQPLIPPAARIDFSGLTTTDLLKLAGMRHGNGHAD